MVGARLGAAANGAGFRGRQVVAYLASLALRGRRDKIPLPYSIPSGRHKKREIGHQFLHRREYSYTSCFSPRLCSIGAISLGLVPLSAFSIPLKTIVC